MASTPRTADALVSEALESIHPRPSDDASRPDKKNFAEKLSRVLAQAFAAAFRARGMTECLPKAQDAPGPSGGERRMAGGIGAKKVDVSWSTDTSGLILALSALSSFQNEALAAGTHWPARCGVLGRARSAATNAPCVLASHSPIAPCRRSVILKRALGRSTSQTPAHGTSRRISPIAAGTCCTKP